MGKTTNIHVKLERGGGVKVSSDYHAILTNPAVNSIKKWIANIIFLRMKVLIKGLLLRFCSGLFRSFEKYLVLLFE